MTLGSLLAVLGRGRILWMMLASLAVLAGTVSMVGALLSQANSKDSEPYLAGGVIGLAGAYAVTTLGAQAAGTLGVRVRLVRDWRVHPHLVRFLVLLAALGALASAAAMLTAATGVLGPLRPTSLASALFYPTMAALGWAHGLAAASAAKRGTPARAPAPSL
ncbi:MAG: hypothetical protein NTU93_09700 [Arthrobacter sp.]|nr:hypothetical protein [Arthrobacter sp.]